MPTAVEALRRGTLNTVHALCWVRSAVVIVCAWLWVSLSYLVKHKGSKLELIQKDVQRLRKLPLHLAVVVNERQIDHRDLAMMVNWCFGAGIHYVSLYDSRGDLSKDIDSVKTAVEQEHQNLFSGESESLEIITCDNEQESTPINNGVHMLMVVGPNDGREELVGVARSLCEQVMQHRITSRDIDTNLINNRLIGNRGGFPEPSLAVVVGPPHSLVGYLPWHTRLTEIVFINSHHKITYQQFHSLLQRYAGTTQRFGK